LVARGWWLVAAKHQPPATNHQPPLMDSANHEWVW
jgi:hypothetical protein